MEHDYTNKSVKINSIDRVIDFCTKLINLDYNVILVADIDDTVLSSKIGQKFVEKNITILADMIYSLNSNNLIFLTARDHDLKRKTLNSLNSSGLLHKGKYIKYNIIHSPYEKNNSTKGQTLLKYFSDGNGQIILSDIKPNWIIFIDDLDEQVT